MNNPLVLIVVALLGGGLIGAVASLITSLAMKRRTDAETSISVDKAPVEIDSLVVQGAETAVLTMKEALLDARARIKQLEDERTGDKETIADLRREITEIRGKAQQCEDKLNALAREHDARD